MALRLFAAAVIALIAFGTTAVRAAEAPVLSEYQVKALFLFNFAKYVDWPSSAFPKDDSPIVIGLVGQDNFGDEFQQVIAGKNINGRPVVIKHLVDPAEFKSCHILFISVSEKGRVSEILNVVKDSAVLTVGETEGFPAQEGMINFTKKANKVRLEINLAAAERANLKLSSKLLSVADVVLGKPEGKKG